MFGFDLDEYLFDNTKMLDKNMEDVLKIIGRLDFFFTALLFMSKNIPIPESYTTHPFFTGEGIDEISLEPVNMPYGSLSPSKMIERLNNSMDEILKRIKGIDSGYRYFINKIYENKQA